MLKNFNTPLKNLQGEVFRDNDKDILLKTICVNALYAPDKENKVLSGEDHMKRHALAKKIHFAEADVDVSSEDISLLKKLVASNYTSIVVGPAFEILEG